MPENKGLSYVDAQLSDVTAWDGAQSMVNPGEYHLKCTKVEGGTSRKGMSKMVASYEVLAAVGELAEENEDMVGRSIVQSYSLDLSKDGVKARLRSLVDAMLGGPDNRGGFDPEAFIDAEMVAEVVSQTYTETNNVTQEPESRNSIKVIRERHVEDYFGEQKASEPEPEPEPEPQRGRGRGRRSNSARAN